MKFYLIYKSESEHTGRYVYIATTLKDAEAHVMDYADWYCDYGTCTIHVVDERCRILERRYYYKGKLR